MGIPLCVVCEKCGSTMAESPKTHLDPVPHEFVAEIHNCALEVRCRRCNVVGTIEQAINRDAMKAVIDKLHADIHAAPTQ